MIQDDGTLRMLEEAEEVLKVMAQTGRRRLFEKGEIVRIEGKDGEYKVDGFGSRFVRLRLLPLAKDERSTVDWITEQEDE